MNILEYTSIFIYYHYNFINFSLYHIMNLYYLPVFKYNIEIHITYINLLSE